MASWLHPLDSLTAQEITKSSEIINKVHPSPTKWIFNSITLLEPAKNLILNHKTNTTGLKIPRKSFTVLIEKYKGQVYEVIVNLTEETIEKFETVAFGKQPTLTPEDCFDAERIVKGDEVVRKKCAELGYINMELIVADPWL